MIRFTLALLLIANLLACPLRCVISCESGVVVDDNPASLTCSCCSHDSDVPASGPPVDRSGTDCSCKNCICAGAVLESDPEPIAPEPSGVVIASVDSIHRLTVFSLNTISGIANDRVARNSGGLNLSGRNALIAYQSWLI